MWITIRIGAGAARVIAEVTGKRKENRPQGCP
jgi:hypothetical protein